ncbi:MAG: SRPBCC family protein [Chloroflexi bacterium]|nr:SRPBCC family protein [Chloroflexota bacterium]
MEFTNSFTAPAPLPTVWEFMLNAREVAPCVPGAQITEEVDATHYKGTIKVKLGAVQMSYRGELEMQPDEASRTIVLRARGTETRGSGGASGTVTTTLTESGDGQTRVDIHSRIDVSGRVAQFGRGIMQDVSNRMIKDFARCLEQKLQSQGATDGGDVSADAAAAVEEAEPSPAAGHPGNPPVSTPAAAPQPPPSSSAEAAPQPPTAPPTSPGTAPNPPSELRLTSLLMTVVRGRTAAALRRLADLVEVK